MQGTAALYGFWKVICSVEKLEKMGQKKKKEMKGGGCHYKQSVWAY